MLAAMAGHDAVRHHDVYADLAKLREKGLPRLRLLDLTSLLGVARTIIPEDELDDPIVIEQALRRGVARLGGGSYGEVAALLFGLVGAARGLGPRERREAASDALSCSSAETFRTRHQKSMVSDLADQLLNLCAEMRLRNARTEMERGYPGESRLAVQWVERFEAYYRIWTQAYALGADLTACRSTLLEPDRPYDEAPDTSDSGHLTYTQEDQAGGYARFALYHFAGFEWELRQFMARFGGLWLLSTPEAELTAQEAVYRVSWHVTPFNERDHSWLRTALNDTRGQELHGFLQFVDSSTIGQITCSDWLTWVESCECSWDLATAPTSDYFPVAPQYEGISTGCQLHSVVAACSHYCRLIDGEWLRIADWYHLPPGRTISLPVDSEALYALYRTTTHHLVLPPAIN